MTDERINSNRTMSELIADRLIKKNRFAMLISVILTFILASILSLIFPSYVAPDIRVNGTYSPAINEVRTISSFILLSCIGGLTYLYTSGAFREWSDRSAQDTQSGLGLDVQILAKLNDSVRDAAEQIKNSKSISENEKSEIRKQIEQLVSESMASEILLKIDEKYSRSIKDDANSSYVEHMLLDTIRRLRASQDKFSLLANASQAWALTTAIFGALIFAYFIFSGPSTQTDDNIGRVFYYTARLGLIAMIESVAFFYFRQYVATLSDYKYMGNEITNVEMRLASITTAIKLESDTTSKLLADLSKVERNFTIKKGEISIFHGTSVSDALPNGTITDIIEKLSLMARDKKSG